MYKNAANLLLYSITAKFISSIVYFNETSSNCCHFLIVL